MTETTPQYLIWSTRLGGWVSVSGGTSEWKEAKQFDYMKALEFCRKQMDYSKTPIAFPVALADVKRLTA